jgi:hypothetical protein
MTRAALSISASARRDGRILEAADRDGERRQALASSAAISA